MFYADLHIHSKYSRACSKNCDLEHLAWWAGRKGVGVVGTGDFTHPAWAEELRENLVPAEPGLFRLRPEVERRVARTLPPACRTPVRFLLSVEISTIYKRAEQTRKVHHLIYAADHAAAERVTRALAKIGNLAADGRPILGLDSRDLLEITLESGRDSYLIPAHAWTPWFSVLGSKSGFDAVADCYADLAEHIFAVETGLSSDPPMNWRVGSLDGYRLVSNSDAHSPPALAREATAFHTPLDYHAIRHALETGTGFGGTVEFFPEEGKYHLDGHRKCEVRMEPAETRATAGRCPTCERPLTVGVLHRVEELADRPDGHRPAGAADFRNLVPLPEIISEIRGVGPRSKTVLGHVAELVSRLGPELSILDEVPIDDVRAAGGELLAEGITRLRRGEVIRDAGFDGEYGVIRLFESGELARAKNSGDRSAALFELPDQPRRPELPEQTSPPRVQPAAAGKPGAGGKPGAARVPRPRTGPEASAPESGLLAGLDPDQRAAAAHPSGPLLIVAGPGTGKTRTLTHRIAHLIAERGVRPERCLAITFTRRAAAEMRERLDALVPDQAAPITVTTFHGLGSTILREVPERAGLTARFQIADDVRRLTVATKAAGTEAAARRLLSRLDRSRLSPPRREPGAPDGQAEGGGPEGGGAEDGRVADGRTADQDLAGFQEAYERELRHHDLADFSDLLRIPVRLLAEDPDLAARYRRRWPWLCVDEYQDVDETQYALLRQLSEPTGNLTAIGDPDQAIYAFRGADVGFFLRFRTDFSEPTTVRLTRNYRSTPTIVAGAVQAISPSTLIPGRALHAVGDFAEDARIGRYEAQDEHTEADFVTRTIDRLIGGTSFHSLDSGRSGGDGMTGLSLADFAVLYRTDAQARPIVDALTRFGIPFQKRSHDRLTARPGVREIAYELRHHGTGTLPERLRSAAATLAGRDEDEDRAIELATAVELLGPLAGRCGGDLDRFLTELALGAEVDAYDPRADRVALLTLHAAKGLEFPVVFLVGCERGLLPFRLPGSAPQGEDGDAEERRLFFVGMTRARFRLQLSYARSRTRHGEARETGPSPFLREIGEELIEHPGTSGPRARPRERQLKLM